jgi:DNA ligase (NAD+)
VSIERIKKLTEELLYHCHLYYDLDSPVLSDVEYDRMYHELEQLENETNFWLANSPTRKVQGSVLDCFTKVEHSKPMLSAAKTKNVDEIKKFLGNNEFYCSYKLDGLTLCVRYSNGRFVQAITRGTGLIGEDVTEQAKMISNLPMRIPYDGDLELRGECVVSWDNFNETNHRLENKYSHPRNLAAGSLRNLDTNITKERKLSYVVFECVSDLYDDGKCFDSKWNELGFLDYLGFETVERMCDNSHSDDAIEHIVEMMSPDSYNYPVDGLVFEMCMKSYSKSLESTAHHEGCRMALKWADETHETTLLNVEWNPTRTGLISPVAIFSEIDLDGAMTTRATLHNLSIIKQLELGIGDTITVYRSNMVIPKIDDNLTRSNTLAIPTNCPCCGAETIIKNTDNSQVIMCPNPDCSAKKIAQFTHFVSRKAMNIDGLSEKTLETLLSRGFIREMRDIYHLNDRAGEITLLDGFGKKSVEKLLNSIEESRNVNLANFICALGIPTIGSSASKTIAEYCEYDITTFLKLLWESRWNTGFSWTELNDFGEVSAKNLDEYFDKNAKMLRELADEMNFIIPEKKTTTSNSFTGKILCVTGKLNHFTRDSINEKIASLGAKAASSVSKKTDYLITNESSGSSKYKKAIELEIPIITEEEFMNMIGD